MKDAISAWALAVALSAVTTSAAVGRAGAQPAAPTLATDRVLQTQRVEEPPSVFWLAAGITLAAGGLALDIDSARRFDDGDPSCYTALEPGGCLVETFAAGPVGTLGGVSLLFYGFWLGEHDASRALAAGQPLTDHSALESWSLIGLLGGTALGVGVNIFAMVRVLGAADVNACNDVPRAERAETCVGGDIFALAILQSVGYAVAAVAAAPLGYTQGYDGKRRQASRGARALVTPWAGTGAFGLALTVQR